MRVGPYANGAVEHPIRRHRAGRISARRHIQRHLRRPVLGDVPAPIERLPRPVRACHIVARIGGVADQLLWQARGDLLIVLEYVQIVQLHVQHVCHAERHMVGQRGLRVAVISLAMLILM